MMMYWLLFLLLEHCPIAVHSLTSPRFQNRKESQCRLHFGSLSQTLVDQEIVTKSASLVNSLTKTSIYQRGSIESHKAIQKLSDLCRQRIPYIFHNDNNKQNTNSISTGSRILQIPKIIPTDTTEQVLQSVQCMLRDGCISTNPDSVDGLPSYHLNLVSNGMPVAQTNNNDNQDSFQRRIGELRNLIEPYIYEKILPVARESLGTNDLFVSDVFLRRYGEVINGHIRNGLSPHYDVTSKATCVIALDDIASDGRNGLYTVCAVPSQCNDNDDNDIVSKSAINYDAQCTSSNHVAHRRFFALSCGDGIFHTWDILHGVDVEPGLDRTSLIVWFSTSDVLRKLEKYNKTDANTSFFSPWILDGLRVENNNVAKFVLASAIESSLDSVEKDQHSITSLTMVSSDTKLCTTGIPNLPNPIQLYIDSASNGNAFAYNRLGSFFCDSESVISDDVVQAAMSALPSVTSTELCTTIGQIFSLPSLHSLEEDGTDEDKQQQQRNRYIGKLFYLAGALRGNPVSQQNLASEIMYDVDSIREQLDDESYSNEVQKPIVLDAVLLSASLFVLVAQQQLFGNNDPSHYSIDALARIVQTEIELNQIVTEEDFLSSPTVQVGNLILEYVC
jgi:hypothetical protein